LKAGKHAIDVLINISAEFQPADAVFTNRIVRYEKLMERAGATATPEDATLRRLVQAADDFIVYRKTTGKMSIIAGYPWFSDWGRDTMISIPGLTLSTGRSEEALQMIEGFIEMAYMGIIPNNFPDEGEAPMYNTSDGTLWLFNAVNAYYEATGDLDAIRRLYPQLMQILNHHLQGTINDIFMDTDGLLSSGNEMTQLTWMDVKVNGWVVTPRHGKAVEINALWYNALAIMNKLTKLLNIGNEAMEVDFEALLGQVKASFNDAFWNAKDQNLYDLIIDGEPVDIPRPNMIFAVSLPYPVLEERRWKAVVNYVTKHFKVPYGLLTLRREDKNFNKTYEGDLLSRDGAYHRGTAWGWLIGPYLEAHLKTFHDRSIVKADLEMLFTHLDEGIHGSISEIFEGGEPHAQRGCSAQAWSVAEALRIWKLIK
jgi:predicted glycogen debranching enzyme